MQISQSKQSASLLGSAQITPTGNKHVLINAALPHRLLQEGDILNFV